MPVRAPVHTPDHVSAKMQNILTYFYFSLAGSHSSEEDELPVFSPQKPSVLRANTSPERTLPPKDEVKSAKKQKKKKTPKQQQQQVAFVTPAGVKPSTPPQKKKLVSIQARLS